MEGEEGRNGFNANPQYQELLQGQWLCCMYRYIVTCRAVCCSSSGPTLASSLQYLMSMACSDPHSSMKHSGCSTTPMESMT